MAGSIPKASYLSVANLELCSGSICVGPCSEGFSFGGELRAVFWIDLCWAVFRGFVPRAQVLQSEHG